MKLYFALLLAAFPCAMSAQIAVQGQAVTGSALNLNPVTVSGVTSVGIIQPLTVGSSGNPLMGAGLSGNDTFTGTMLAMQTTGGANAGLIVYPLWWDGTVGERQFTCPNTLAINASGAATTQIIALSSTKTIRICGGSVVLGGTTPTFQLVTGTGTNCATGTASLTGPMPVTPGAPFSLTPGNTSAIRGALSSAVCIAMTGTTPTAGGFLTYAQY